METVRNLTVEQARDMIHSIDTSLIPECRDFDTYTETDDIWRIGDYGYVDADVYEQAFRDYEERNGKTEWARTMYVLEGNQPTCRDRHYRSPINAEKYRHQFVISRNM